MASAFRILVAKFPILVAVYLALFLLLVVPWATRLHRLVFPVLAAVSAGLCVVLTVLSGFALVTAPWGAGPDVLLLLENAISLTGLWILVPLTAILPTGWYIRHRRDRIKRAGKCNSCGYDLRHSSDKCPECGAPRDQA